MFNSCNFNRVKALGLATALAMAVLQWQTGDIAGAIGVVAAALSSSSIVTATSN